MRNDLHKYRRILIERSVFPTSILLTVAALLVIAVSCWYEAAR